MKGTRSKMYPLIFTLSIAFAASLTIADSLNPIILVPGIGGSQIEAKLDKNIVKDYCYKNHSGYFPIWVNLADGFYRMECFLDDLRLHYDPKTRKTTTSPGVQTQIPGFGTCSTVEFVDCNRWNKTRYFFDTVLYLTQLGYIPGQTLRAAPYDFRKGPTEQEDFFVNFKALIEDTYTKSGNKKVIIMPHSMGGIMTVAFLRRQSKEWKDKHIRAMVSLAGAYGGAVKAVRVVMNGYEVDLPPGLVGGHAFHLHKMSTYMNLIEFQSLNVDDNKVRKLMRSFPGVMWLFPSPKAWKKTDVLILGKKKNYTLDDLKEYFGDVDYQTGWEMYQDALPTMNDLGHPGVEVHCLYGTGVDTVEQITCTSDDLSSCHGVIQGDGDGTVNVRSLEMCRQWEAAGQPPVKYAGFDKASHMGILTDQRVLKYISDFVTGTA